MLRLAIIGTLVLLSAAQASAAPLTVRVVDAKGRPVKDAVVSLKAGQNGAPGGSGNYTVSQKDMEFRPFVSIVPVGAKVHFSNLDPTRHHVYSFSAAKRFELKLFAKDQSRSVTFDKPGVVALGCNIHDSMTAFVYVTDSKWTAKTGADGTVKFASAPDAPGRLSIWHPYLRAKANVVERQLAASQRNVSFNVELRSPPMVSHGY